jgi:hypothetical protein
MSHSYKEQYNTGGIRARAAKNNIILEEHELELQITASHRRNRRRSCKKPYHTTGTGVRGVWNSLI